MKTSRYLIGNCPKCRKQINVNNLISVGCKLENIVNFKFSDEEKEKPEEKTIEKIVEPHKERTKIDGIIDIIQGKIPIEAVEKKIFIDQLQSGESIYVPSPSDIKKVIIFAAYDEAIVNISKEIKNNNIKYWTLKGTAQHISATANEFNKCQTTCVLIINSTNHCSGLNLQTATDLIFSHAIQDKNILSQACGRIQRIGRTCTAKIWFMIFENEMRWLNEN